MPQDYTTIRVTETAKESAEASKRDDETWNDFLLRCTENPPEPREFVPADEVVPDTQPLTADDIGLIANAIADELESRRR